MASISEINYYKRDCAATEQAARDWAGENPRGYRGFLWKPPLRMGKGLVDHIRLP